MPSGIVLSERMERLKMGRETDRHGKGKSTRCWDGRRRLKKGHSRLGKFHTFHNKCGFQRNRENSSMP